MSAPPKNVAEALQGGQFAFDVSNAVLNLGQSVAEHSRESGAQSVGKLTIEVDMQAAGGLFGMQVTFLTVEPVVHG